MPALNFKVFIDKIESGEKRQTIRPIRKYPIKRGDKLYLYTGMRHKNCRKLGEAICSKIIPVTFRLIDLFEDGTEINLFIFHRNSIHSFIFKMAKQLALDDGFNGIDEFNSFFISTYKIKVGVSQKFDIIKWRDFRPAGVV